MNKKLFFSLFMLSLTLLTSNIVTADLTDEPTEQINITDRVYYGDIGQYYSVIIYNPIDQGMIKIRSGYSSIGFWNYSNAIDPDMYADLYSSEGTGIVIGNTFVKALNVWFGISGTTVYKMNRARNITHEYTGFSDAINIADDEQYLYVMYSDGVVKKYDFNLNFVTQVKGAHDVITLSSGGGFAYSDHYKAFVETRGSILRIYDKNFLQYGEDNLIIGGTGISLQMVGVDDGTLYMRGKRFDTWGYPHLYLYEYDIHSYGVLPPVNVAENSAIFKGVNTINIGSDNQFPISHAKDDYYQYILSEATLIDNITIVQTLNGWDNSFIDDFSVCMLAGITDDGENDLKFLGKSGHYFLLRSTDNIIYQVTDVGCDHISTQYLSGVTSGGDLKVIGNQLYVMSGEGRILVYTVNKNVEGIISYVYQYEFGLNENMNYDHTFMAGYGDLLFMLDAVKLKLYIYDTLGTFKQAHMLQDWNYTSSPKDIFFYNNKLFIIAKEEKLAIEYVVPALSTEGFINLGGDKYSTIAYCMDETRLCDSPDHFVQPNGDISSICLGGMSDCVTEGNTGGCSNTLNDADIITGSCGDVSCEMECDTLNLLMCNGLNTYNICGNFDIDACYELGTTFSCPTGQICVNDGIYSGCEIGEVTNNLLTPIDITKEVKHTNSAVSMAGDTYFLESPFQTSYLAFNLVSYPLQVDYSTSIQDYKETILTNRYMGQPDEWKGVIKTIETDTDGRKHKQITNTQTIYHDITQKEGNKRVTYDFNLKEGWVDRKTSMYVQLTDENDSIISEINYLYEPTTKTLEISLSNGGSIGALILNDTGLTHNLWNIHTEVIIMDQIKSLSYAFTIFREINGDIIPYRYYTKPFQYTHSNTKDLSRITFEPTERILSVFGFEVVEIPDFNGYNKAIVNEDYANEKFSFTKTGCTVNRVYGNEFAIPTYFFYDEVEICVSKVGDLVDVDIEEQGNIGSGESDIEKLINKTLTKSQKVLVAVSVMTILFAVFYFVYRESEEKFILGVGAVITGLLMFYFALIGFIPAWILIILILIASGLVVKQLTNTFAK